MNAQPSVEFPEHLASACLEHLDAEQAALQSALESLRMLRDALVQRRNESILEAVQAQNEAADATEKLATERHELRRQLAPFLKLPPREVTFAVLAQTNWRHAAQVAKQRLQLLAMAEEADLLNRTNIALTQQGIEVLGGVLNCLAGEETEPCYDQAGQVESAPAGSLIQKQC